MLESLQPWRRGSSGTNSNGVVVRDAFIHFVACRAREGARHVDVLVLVIVSVTIIMDIWMILALVFGAIILKMVFGGQKYNLPAPKKRRPREFFPNGRETQIDS